MLLSLYVRAFTWLTGRFPAREAGGQATSEYALVLLGAAAIALLVVGWATKSNKVGHLLDRVLDRLLDQVR